MLEFLGILIDTSSFQLRLPAAKLTHLQALCEGWASKTHCRRRELESFLGHLSHAATVVCQGRTFLRELFSLLAQARKAHFFIRLNTRACADILWWRTFLQDWSGSSFFPSATPSVTVINLWCLRLIWVRCILPPTWLVPGQVAPILAVDSHYSQRTRARGSGSSSVGAALAGIAGSFPIR